MKLDLDVKDPETLPAKLSIDKPSELEIKILPPHLWYVFLGQNSTFLVIIPADLNEG